MWPAKIFQTLQFMWGGFFWNSIYVLWPFSGHCMCIAMNEAVVYYVIFNTLLEVYIILSLMFNDVLSFFLTRDGFLHHFPVDQLNLVCQSLNKFGEHKWAVQGVEQFSKKEGGTNLETMKLKFRLKRSRALTTISARCFISVHAWFNWMFVLPLSNFIFFISF